MEFAKRGSGRVNKLGWEKQMKIFATADIHNKRIQMIINTPVGRESKHDDSYIRKAAIQHKIPYITTIAAALATVEGIEAAKYGNIEIKSIQEYHC